MKWYERDGLLTCYDQRKCQEFLEEPDKHFQNAKLVNFYIINKWIRGEEMFHKNLKNYHTIHKNKVFEYPSKDREKVMSAALKSTVKRTDVYISADLVKDHFNTPINEKKNFIFYETKKNRQKERQAFISTENILKWIEELKYKRY